MDRTTDRAGLTMLECVGCTAAIAGGVWLGAMYLGTDLGEAAHTALAETELLEKVPPTWRPEGLDDIKTPEQKVAKLRDDFASLSDQIAALRNDQNGLDGADDSQTPPSAVDTAARDQTLAFWQAVNQIAIDEAKMQRDAEEVFDATNAAKVFSIKARASEFAAEALALIPEGKEVDISVVRFTRQLADWYNDGATLYDRAVLIWESPTGAKSREQLNEEWSRAELQHRNEAGLISAKAAKLRSALSRHYGVEFAEFARAEQRRLPETPSQNQSD